MPEGIAGEGQRERETQNSKQRPGSVVSAQKLLGKVRERGRHRIASSLSYLCRGSTEPPVLCPWLNLVLSTVLDTDMDTPILLKETSPGSHSW